MTDISSPSAANICDLVIVGAGPAGATLALAAAQAGFSVTLIDARDPAIKRPDGRNFAIVRGSWRLLQSVGITDGLADAVQPLNGLEATDGGRHWFGAPSALFTTDDLPNDLDGTPLGYMIQAPKLQAALDTAITAQNNIKWLKNTKFHAHNVSQGVASVELHTGETLHTRLIAGCDGVNSPVRTAAKIQVEGREYGKSVFAANVSLSRPHHGLSLIHI